MATQRLSGRAWAAWPALDLPALTFSAWYQAQVGRAAWQALEKIPRLQWAEYLSWYGRVLALDVRSEHEIKAVGPRKDHVVELSVEHDGKLRTVLARRVVLALGLEAFGGPLIPDFVRGLPRDRWSHSIEPLDYRRLAGKRVGVGELISGNRIKRDSNRHHPKSSVN